MNGEGGESWQQQKFTAHFFENGDKAIFCTVLRVVMLFEDVTCTPVHTRELKMKGRFE